MFGLFLTISVILLPPSAQHFITPPTWCQLANMCNHTGVPECGKEIITEHNKNIKMFLDECDIFEYNCDNRKEYKKVDMVNCQKIPTTSSFSKECTRSATTLKATVVLSSTYLSLTNNISSKIFVSVPNAVEPTEVQKRTFTLYTTRHNHSANPITKLTKQANISKVTFPATYNYIRNPIQILRYKTFGTIFPSHMSPLIIPKSVSPTTKTPRKPVTLKTTRTGTLRTTSTLSSTHPKAVSETFLPATKNFRRNPIQTFKTVTNSLSSTSPQPLSENYVLPTKQCTCNLIQTLATTMITSPKTISETSLSITKNCTRDLIKTSTTFTNVTTPPLNTLSSTSSKTESEISYPTSKNCTRNLIQSSTTSNTATTLPPNTLSSTITLTTEILLSPNSSSPTSPKTVSEISLSTTKNCTRNLIKTSTTSTTATTPPPNTLSSTSSKSVLDISIPTNKNCTRDLIQTSTTSTSATTLAPITLSSTSPKATSTTETILSSNFSSPTTLKTVSEISLPTTKNCTRDLIQTSKISATATTLPPNTLSTTSPKTVSETSFSTTKNCTRDLNKTSMTTTTASLVSTLPLPPSIIDISTSIINVIEPTIDCTRSTKSTNHITTSTSTSSLLSPLSALIPTSTTTLITPLTVTINKNISPVDPTISAHCTCTKNYSNTMSTKTTLSISNPHQLSTTGQVTKSATITDVTKAIVECNKYSKNCKRPITWETTDQGETRDFFQILRAKFGTRVRLLRATTHFPIRAPFFIHNRL